MATQQDYVSQILSAFLGGSVATLIREVINRIRRPKLEMALDFSALRPFHQFDSQNSLVAVNKYVRIRIHNNGLRAAYHCEAKLEPLDAHENSLFDPSILHWVRRSPAVYPNREDQYAPITINREDHEFLDIIYVSAILGPPNYNTVFTYSHRPITLEANTDYRLKVTVFSDNAEPESMTIGFRWDGTWDGFNEQCANVVN